MRVEFISKRLNYFLELDDSWTTRSIIHGLIEIYSILSRTDVRREVITDLDRYIYEMRKYRDSPLADEDRARELQQDLESLKVTIENSGSDYLKPLRDNEFLNSLLHRQTLPGGKAEFDMPKYKFWLDSGRTKSDIDQWVGVIKPVCSSIDKLLWMIRESTEAISTVAVGGFYNHQISKNHQISLVRIFLNENTIYPEISGGKHLISIRFFNWGDSEENWSQTKENINFRISLC
jgi:cell division protein ZapD